MLTCLAEAWYPFYYILHLDRMQWAIGRWRFAVGKVSAGLALQWPLFHVYRYYFTV